MAEPPEVDPEAMGKDVSGDAEASASVAEATAAIDAKIDALESDATQAEIDIKTAEAKASSNQAISKVGQVLPEASRFENVQEISDTLDLAKTAKTSADFKQISVKYTAIGPDGAKFEAAYKGTMSGVRTFASSIFTGVDFSSLDSEVKTLSDDITSGKATPADVTDVANKAKNIANDASKKDPTADEKMESKFGKYKLIMMLVAILAVVGSSVAVALLLAKEYSGCYQFITEGNSTKLNCDYSGNEGACSCGPAARGQASIKADDCKTDKTGDYPYCKCLNDSGPTCGADLTVKGAVSYAYQDIGPIEALVKGVESIAGGLLSDLGLGNLGTYIKYFAIGVIVIIFIAFAILIIKYVIGKFGSNKTNHESVEK